MASFASISGSVGRNALDLPVAALAGLAVAFVAYAIPGDLLAELVTMSGLPAILPAAQPPLGDTARAGFGIAAALAAFGLVFLLLRLLDRTTGAEASDAPAAPRVRRRDSHPDAPAPRPIAALRDLGEPEAHEAVPLWLAPADAAGAEVSPRDEEEDALELTIVADAQAEAHEVHGLEQIVEAEAEPERPVHVPEAPKPAPEPVQPVRAEAAELPAGGVSELMARLERGLAARRAAAEAPIFAASAPNAPEPARDFAPEPADDRLQSAIASLQRFAQQH